MRCFVNGVEHDFEHATLCCEALLEHIGVPKDGLIAEIDGKVFTVTQFKEAVIKDGSKVEFIRMMGGG